MGRGVTYISRVITLICFNFDASVNLVSFFKVRLSNAVYSCFQKGCPTKPYPTMAKGVMGNGVPGP